MSKEHPTRAERLAILARMNGEPEPLPDPLVDPVGYIEGAKAQAAEARLAELIAMQNAPEPEPVDLLAESTAWLREEGRA